MAREYILIIVITVTESRKGVWGFPGNAFVDIQTLCLQYTFAPYSNTETVSAGKFQKAVRPIGVNHIQIHSKILTRKGESMSDSLCTQKVEKSDDFQ